MTWEIHEINTNMKTSQLGINLIKSFEGFSKIAYLDGASVPTIGYGTTVVEGTPVTLGMTCTEQEAEKWLLDDVSTFERAVTRLAYPPIKEQHQFDALVCFAYNVGSGALAKSTLLKRIKANLPIVESNFTVWNKITVNGKLVESAGLTRRRKSEYTLFSQNRLQFKF